MTAISGGGHYQCLAELKKHVHSLNKDQQEELKTEVEQLHRTYEQYLQQLSFLRKLIADYEELHRRIKVDLRKQIIKKRRHA